MKFVISYINFFDNELHSEIITEDSLLGAIKVAYLKHTDTEYEDDLPQEIENIKQAAFDCDGMINAIEI